MVKYGLHLSLRTRLVRPLNADVFVHVDSEDTRQWGRTKAASSEEYAEAVRVLRPLSAKLVSYSPPPSPLASCPKTSGVCAARDCGTFGCGCYLPSCTHCAVGQYVPQHEHTRHCLEMIEEVEARRGRRYELVVKIRPDLNVTRPVRGLNELAAELLGSSSGAGRAPHSPPPVLCAQGGGAPVGDAEPLASLPLTLDDKFALMTRDVASVYMNATHAFGTCQSRRANTLTCGGDRGGGGGMAGKGELLLGKRRSMQALHTLHSNARGGGIARGGASLRSKGSRLTKGDAGGGGHSPYWATPQCVLKRHLISSLPEMRMVDCLRKPGERPLLRLIRPEMRADGTYG